MINVKLGSLAICQTPPRARARLSTPQNLTRLTVATRLPPSL